MYREFIFEVFKIDYSHMNFIYILKEKIHITHSNYHLIVNVPPNYQLYQCPLPKLPKTVNVPIMTKIPFIKLLK
jgi:hypothetical protein